MYVSCTVDPNLHIDVETCQVKQPIVVRVNEFDEKSAQIFARQVSIAEDMGQPIIPVVIDSYGGDVYSLLAMVDVIKSCKAIVATIVEGKAMSCAAVLFSCGTEGYRFVSEHATVMIHDTWQEDDRPRKAEDLKVDAAELGRINKLFYEILAGSTGHDPQYFIDMLSKHNRADVYFSAQEAVKHNIANHIGIPDLTLEVAVSYKISLATAPEQVPLATLVSDLPKKSVRKKKEAAPR